MAYLPHPVTSKVVQQAGTQLFRATAVSMNGWRSSMEDAHALDLQPGHAFLGVFDGHAGEACAKHCSSAFTKRIRQATKPVSSALAEALCQEIDAEFLDTNPEDKSGCTGTMALVTPRNDAFLLQLMNVGDSRTLVIRDGEVVLATRDHKPRDREELARLRSVGAHVELNSGYVLADNGIMGLAVSRAFGDRDFKRRRGKPDIVSCIPDCKKFHCRKGDLVFLACDGVYDVMSNVQIALFLNHTTAKGTPPATALKQLLDDCLQRTSQDNMTALLLEFRDGSDHQPPVDYVPGLYLPFSSAFHLAYRSMARHAHLKLPAALQQRCALTRHSNHHIGATDFERQEQHLFQAAHRAADETQWFVDFVQQTETLLQRRRAPMRQNVQDVLALMASLASKTSTKPPPAKEEGKKKKKKKKRSPASAHTAGEEKSEGFDPATEHSARTGPIQPLTRLHSVALSLPLPPGKRPRQWPPPWVEVPK